MHKIKVNGKQELLRERMSIMDYLEKRSVNPDGVIIVYNNTVISRTVWPETLLQAGDTVEVLKMMGGG